MNRQELLAKLRQVWSFSPLVALLEKCRRCVDRLLTSRGAQKPDKTEIPAPAAPQPGMIRLDNADDALHLAQNVANVQPIRELATQYPDNIAREINKVCAFIENTNPPEYEDETSIEKAVDLILDIYKRLENLLNYTSSADGQGTPDRAPLRTALENYLENLGVKKLAFHPGGNAEAWHSLNMTGGVYPQPTQTASLWGTIAQIYLQPRKIEFQDRNRKPQKVYFGGSCSIYCRLGSTDDEEG